MVVGDRAAVDSCLESDLMAASHEELRDRLVPDFGSLSEAEKEQVERDTVYGWLRERRGQFAISLPEAYLDRLEAVSAAVDEWVAEHPDSLKSAPAEELSWDSFDLWAEEPPTRPWIVLPNRGVVVGEPGSHHRALAASSGLEVTDLVALGQIVGKEIIQYRGDCAWWAVVEQQLAAR